MRPLVKADLIDPINSLVHFNSSHNTEANINGFLKKLTNQFKGYNVFLKYSKMFKMILSSV